MGSGVAHLVERSLPTLEVCDSNPVFGQFYNNIKIIKTENKSENNIRIKNIGRMKDKRKNKEKKNQKKKKKTELYLFSLVFS